MDRPRVAQILSRLLLDKKITISELARQINLPQPTIYRIAHGECANPHVSSLQPIADFFSLTVDQLRGLDPIHSIEKISKLIFLDWMDAIRWPANKNKFKNSERVLTSAPVSSKAYVLRVKDLSMEPIFMPGTFLIVDPEKQPKDRSYVIAKISGYAEPIFRQLIINAKNRYLKPLTPDLKKYKMTPLNCDDLIIATLVQATRNFAD